MSEGIDSVDFMVKYGTWVSIKKMSINEKTKPEEVVMHLASIRSTIDRKAFELLGIDVKSLDEVAATFTAGKRKNYGTLGEILTDFGKKDMKAAVEKAINGKEELKNIAGTYLFRSIVRGLGFDFDVNPEVLQKAYPELKIPKPPGRQRKG
ncbi:MAG: DUF2666 family protein [Candidatus Micrarchaeota archaeon]|nr:DUF2666 family protein [Candidatus Micrarchaeota archaeon]